MIAREKIAELKSSGLWAVRNDNGCIGYGGFEWSPVGEWTECTDWDGLPTESSGLFGQGPGGWGHMLMGNRFCLIEIDDSKICLRACVKAKRAKILAVDQEAIDLMIELCDGDFPGQLVLQGNKSINLDGLKCISFLYLTDFVRVTAVDLIAYDDISVDAGAALFAPNIK